MKQIKLIGKAIAFLSHAIYDFCFGAVVRIGLDKATFLDLVSAAMRLILAAVFLFGLTGTVAVVAKTWMTWALYIALFRAAYGVLNIITEGKCMKFDIKKTFTQKCDQFKAQFAAA